MTNISSYILAVALEYEFPFSQEYNILYTGVGKVEATISLCRFLSKNPHIKTVINVGTAGGINCQRGSILECGIFHDGQLNYPGYIKNIITTNEQKSTIYTFDTFISKICDKKCDCIDMEAYALARVCQKMNVEFLCFKYISDIIGEENQESKWVENITSGKKLLKEKIKQIL